MNVVEIWGLFGLLAYLLGAVPNGFIVARARGVDIRKVGSGNIGATNVFRTVGKRWGILTFVADALKGFIPAWWFPILAEKLFGFEAGKELAVFCAAMAIVGHNWPVYLKFKGGKGVATSAGALLGIAPLAVGIGILVWAGVFLSTRYVSVASIVVSLMLPLIGWFVYARDGLLIRVVLMILGVVIVLRHHSNIRRLIQGTEHRFSFGKKTPGGDPKP